jgi:hypothetical protein
MEMKMEGEKEKEKGRAGRARARHGRKTERMQEEAEDTKQQHTNGAGKTKPQRKGVVHGGKANHEEERERERENE